MPIRVAINGFGRIGRLVFRGIYNDPRFEVVAINDLTSAKTLAHLLKYDSTQGKFNESVSVTDTGLQVGKNHIEVTAEKDPKKLQWADNKTDIVVESTGAKSFRDRAGVQQHIDAGAKKVLLTVPSKDEIDATIVLGINDKDLKPEHKLVSERKLHDELRRTDGESVVGQLRHRTRIHDHYSQLHERPEHP